MATTKTVTASAAGLAKAQAIYSTMSANAKSLIPEPTAENAKEFGKALLQYDPTYNEFLSGMVNRVVYGRTRNAEDKNPFSIMEKGSLEYGYTIEEAFADALSVEDWTACDTEDFSELFGQNPARVYTVFYNVNFQKKVKATISDRIMRRAFSNWAELNDVIARIVRTLYTSMIGEERRTAASLLMMAHEGGFVYPVKVNSVDVTNVDPDNMRANAIMIQATANRLAVNASRDYNYMGVSTLTELEDCYIFLTPEYVAAQGVDVLAISFNMEKAELLGHIVMVGDFGGAEEDGCVGFMVDKNWMQIWIEGRQMTYQYNAAKRIWNYFYFTDAIFAFCQFANCVELVSSLKSITSVTVTASQQAAKCAQTKIQATIVNGGEAGGWSSKMNWSISGQQSKKTFISPFGLLYVAPDETAGSINVTATSAQDPSKTNTQEVTIVAA